MDHKWSGITESTQPYTHMHKGEKYRIAGKFGGELNLAVLVNQPASHQIKIRQY